jgi:Mce-associated membrane protein
VTTEPETEADLDLADEPEEPEEPGPRWSAVRIGALVLVAAALAYAGWFGVSWWRAAGDARDYATLRDEVLLVAEQGVVNLTTMDYTKFDEGMSRWRDSSTGALRESLVQDSATSRTRITELKTSTSGTVVDAAVTELDDRAGVASAIVAAEITVTEAGGQPAVRRNRFRVELTRTGDGWKLSALAAVPVGASS